MSFFLRCLISVVFILHCVNALAGNHTTVSRYSIEQTVSNQTLTENTIQQQSHSDELHLISKSDQLHKNSHNHPITRMWTVWRDSRSIEIQENNIPVSVAWERLSSGSLQRWDVYHDYKTAVHYTTSDARLLGIEQQWGFLPNLFDGSLLKHLQSTGQVIFKGKIAERFVGMLGTSSYKIVWLNEPDIPALIEIKSPTSDNRISLLDTHVADKTHEERVNWRNEYDDLEYDDLGDNEAHPLVKAFHHQGPRFVYPEH